jgi:hypothetical protein
MSTPDDLVTRQARAQIRLAAIRRQLDERPDDRALEGEAEELEGVHRRL